jgi:hypothetical protein
MKGEGIPSFHRKYEICLLKLEAKLLKLGINPTLKWRTLRLLGL